jgi:hypothetical protein
LSSALSCWKWYWWCLVCKKNSVRLTGFVIVNCLPMHEVIYMLYDHEVCSNMIDFVLSSCCI